MAKDFYWVGKFESRPKAEVHFFIMKWSWKLLYQVVKNLSHPGDDQLIQIGEDALPKRPFLRCLPLLKTLVKKIFEKSKTKTGLILPLVERLYGISDGNGRLPFVQTPNLIYKILFYNDAHRKDLEIYKTNFKTPKLSRFHRRKNRG